MAVSTDTATKAVQQILTENVVSLTEARDIFSEAFNRRVDKSTVARWMHRGAGGVKLAHVRMGNQLFTSTERCTAFIAERTAKS